MLSYLSLSLGLIHMFRPILLFLEHIGPAVLCCMSINFIKAFGDPGLFFPVCLLNHHTHSS